jgi:hypothetical protein
VVVQNLLVDSLKDIFLGGQARHESHVTAEAQVNGERTRLGVHASEEKATDEFEALLERLSVVDQIVVNDLANEADRGLSQILVLLRHVQVIEEVDHDLASGWTLPGTGLTADSTFDNVL